jgi:hypothetical protein
VGGDDMAFEDPGLWGAKDTWPIAPINFVFLLDAADQIGAAMCGPEWSTPPFDRDDEGSKRFEHVITKIAEACETGELPARYRRGDGELAPMEPADWRWSSPEIPRAWMIFFYAGQLLENDLALLEMFDRDDLSHPVERPLNVCWIFVGREGLDRFISGIATAPSPNMLRGRAAGLDVKKKVRAYIAALPGDRIVNEKHLWEWAKAKLPRARREQVLAAKRAIVGNPGRGRARKSNPQNQIPKK